MTIAGIVYWICWGYFWCGIVVAAAFLAFGLERIDPSSKGAYAFRPLLIPGLTLLWPLVVLIWRRRVLSAMEA